MNTSTSPSGSSADDTSAGDAVKLAIAWSIVGVPLLYGLATTINKAIPLFTG